MRVLRPMRERHQGVRTGETSKALPEYFTTGLTELYALRLWVRSSCPETE